MSAISGSFSGRVVAHTGSTIPDQPEHTMVLITISGRHTSDNDLWNDAEITYWGAGDMLSGNGIEIGYFHNRHANGDSTFGNFEGRVIATEGESNVEGAWNLRSGTGVFAGISGAGKYTARTKDSIMEMTWTGEYSLLDAK